MSQSLSRTLGLPRIHPGTRLTESEKRDFTEKVVTAYSKATIQEIADETGRSYRFIYRLLKAANVSLRRPGQRPQGRGHDRRTR